MWVIAWMPSMTSKIFRSTVFVVVIVLLCSLSIVMGVLYNHFTGVQVQQLKNELSLAVTGMEHYGNAFLENVEAERFRITWIDSNETVLFDTLIELYNERAIENVLAADMFRPRRIIFLCPTEIAQIQQRQKQIGDFFRHRGWDPELIFYEASQYKADRILRQLQLFYEKSLFPRIPFC